MIGVGLDIGNSKISCIVCDINLNKQIYELEPSKNKENDDSISIPIATQITQRAYDLINKKL